MQQVLCNNYIPTNLHRDTRTTSWDKISKDLDLLLYQRKHIRQKSLQKYMKFWKSRIARLNNMFDSYIKENYKVVDYDVKTPSLREHNLTWRPYGYYKRRRSKIAHSKCIARGKDVRWGQG